MRSKIVPSAVHTGSVNGWRETAQKLKGRRLKGALAELEDEFGPCRTPEPALAE